MREPCKAQDTIPISRRGDFTATTSCEVRSAEGNGTGALTIGRAEPKKRLTEGSEVCTSVWQGRVSPGQSCRWDLSAVSDDKNVERVPGGARLEGHLTPARVLAAPLVSGSRGGLCSPLFLSRCAVTGPLLRSGFSRRCGLSVSRLPGCFFTALFGADLRGGVRNLALVLDVLIELATQRILLCFVLGGSSSK